MPEPKWYDDFKQDEAFETPGRTITESDIMNFAGVSGDFYGLHTDEIFASKTIFGTRIAHGLLVLSAITGLWFRTGLFEGTIVAFYGIDKLRWVLPVRIGDTIMACVRVGEKEPRKSGGLVTFHNEVCNQEGKVVLTFDAKLLISHRPSP